MVSSESEYNFGSVWEGDKVAHAFKIRNTGDKELRIEEPKFIGRATTARFKRILQAGQGMEMILTVDTTKVSGEVSTGIIVHTNDPALPRMEFRIKGEVKPVIEIQPSGAMFFSVYKGNMRENSVTIVNRYQRPLKIRRIESESDRFSYELKPVREGMEYQFLVKVNARASLGRSMEKVTFITDNEKMPQFSVGVNIFVKDDVYTFPDKVNFGAVDMQSLKKNPQILDLLTQTILIKRREGKGTDFQIKLEHDIPFISIKQEPASGSETYRLDISLVVDKISRGKINTFIKVLTNDREVPEIRIPVTGEII